MEKDIEPEKADFTYSPTSIVSMLELYSDEELDTLDTDEIEEVDYSIKNEGTIIDTLINLIEPMIKLEPVFFLERETTKQISSDLSSAEIIVPRHVTLPIFIDKPESETWQSNYIRERKRTRKCLQLHNRYIVSFEYGGYSKSPVKKLPENMSDLTERVNVISQKSQKDLLTKYYTEDENETRKIVKEKDTNLLFLELIQLLKRTKSNAAQERRIYLLADILKRRISMRAVDDNLVREIALFLTLGDRFSGNICENSTLIENAMKDRRGYPIHGLIDAACIRTSYFDESVPAIIETFDTYLKLCQLKTIIALTWACPAFIRATHDKKLLYQISKKIEEGLQKVDSKGTIEQRIDYITALANIHIANPSRVNMLRNLAYHHPLRMQSELCRRYLY